MKTSLRMIALTVMVGVALVLTACGGGSAPASGGAASTGPVTIDISSKGEELAFDKTTLTASAGQQVTVKFVNTSAVQQHNWILVKGGDAAAAEIANAGLSAGAAANFLPTGNANIVANTALANGGDTVEVTFTAPAAGTYLFICTVPGHYPLMQGTMTVN